MVDIEYITRDEHQDVQKLFHAELESLCILVNSNTKSLEQALENQKQTIKDIMTNHDAAVTKAEAVLNQRFADHKEAILNALNASDKAIIKAENATEKRFDGVNEFRAALSDQQRTLMPRSEVEIIFKTLGEKIENLSKQVTEKIDTLQIQVIEKHGEKMGLTQGIGYIVGVIGVLVAIFIKFVK
jgi:uncharacterized membrane protein